MSELSLPSTYDTAFIDRLFGQGQEEAIALLEQEYAKLQAQPSVDEATKQEQTQFLVAFWNFFQSLLSMRNANFELSLQQMQAAQPSFVALKMDTFSALAGAFITYFEAIIDIRTGNYQSGLELIQSARTQFDQIPNYGEYYAAMVDTLESEGFFIAGINYLLQLDVENAQVNFNKAEKGCKQVAMKYYAPESPNHQLYLGLGAFYAAYGSFSTQMNRLNTLDFSYFDYAENEAATLAAEAMEHLGMSLEIGEIAQNSLRTAKVINLLSQVVYQSGKTMHLLVQAEPGAIHYPVASLKKMVVGAHKFCIEIGDTGLSLARLSKQIDQTVGHVAAMLPQSAKAAVKASSQEALVKEFIQEGKTAKALEEMFRITVEADLFNELIVLKGRLSRVKKELRQDVISTQDAHIEENKIAAAILSMLED